MDVILSLLSLETIVQLILLVIACASILVRILEFVTGIHPSDRLDRYASRTKKFIAWVEAMLDRLALNPKRDEPRT